VPVPVPFMKWEPMVAIAISHYLLL
jgi:hypothetical protein